MAKGTCKHLFLFLIYLLPLCSSGTLVGFSYHAKENAATSLPSKTISFLKLNKVSPSQIRVFAADTSVLSSLSHTGVSVDLYLSETRVANLINSNSSATSWLKTQIVNLLPHVKIKSITVSSTTYGNSQSQDHEFPLPMLLSTLKLIHSGLSSFRVDRDVKVSAAFSLSFLETLNVTQGRDLQRICNFIEKAGSSIIVEASIEGELSVGDQFVRSMIERAEAAVSVLSGTDVSIVLTITSPAVPSPTEVAELSNKVIKHLQNNTNVTGRIAGLYAEVSLIDDFARKELEREEEHIFPSSHRELIDEMNPPTTTFPITPISATPITIPPDTPAPTIVTVPATNPVTVTPTNPTSTPVPIPSTTPIIVPSADPTNNSPVPITNPVTTPPITNPVTTYPSPPGNVPVTSPVTNPVAPPATTNAPAVPGQSWCVAKTGAPESSVQAALDYACGIGGADCAPIQQSGSCYNPNTLQNHASYAFNSYYQKNPTPTSCDFGGAATVVNTNPSTGSCVFPSSASSSSSSTSSFPPVTSVPTPTPTPPTAQPAATPTPTTTPTPPTSSSSGAGTPPMVLNPALGTPTVFGSEVPPSVNTSTTSISARLQPFIGCIVLVTSFVTQKLVQEM